jgi:hypothetical protein
MLIYDEGYMDVDFGDVLNIDLIERYIVILTQLIGFIIIG